MAARRVIAVVDGRTICDELIVADRFWSRLVGLQFRRSLATGQGLLLTPCSSIHTCFMRFAIDLIWLDETQQVVELSPNIAPWRFVIPTRSARAVLELPAGSSLPAVGEQLAVV
ncbi:MAG: DUF192 domain-containing protein [Planctomycetaceae bacterium]|nr:DUF192 domain-containing protein [Planctomycetaceae bacterium]